MRHSRFQLTQTEKRFSLRPMISVGLFAVLICLFINGFGSISSDTRNRQRESLENALSRNLLHFYSLEGRYPDSLETLSQKYGLIYDRNYFYIDYRFLGDNIYPDITILEEGKDYE